MGCDTSKMTVTRPVWTTGTAGGGDIFIPFTRIAQNDCANVRMSYLLEAIGPGNIEVRPATRGSKDGWTYPVPGGAAWPGNTGFVSASGWTWGDAYYAPDDDYQWMEFGLIVRNKSGGGTGKEGAVVTLVIDVRK